MTDWLLGWGILQKPPLPRWRDPRHLHMENEAPSPLALSCFPSYQSNIDR